MMESLHAEGMYVVIGDEYAKRLDYEGLVGSMGVIDSVLNALCGVTVLSGNTEMIGKQVDIHIQDCLLQEYGEMGQYNVVINLRTGAIYYSERLDIIEFVEENILKSQRIRSFRNVAYMHEVMDFCEENMESTRISEGFDWIMYCLDDRDCEKTRVIRDTFEAHVVNKQRPEAFKKVALPQQKVVDSLVDSLKKQMEANIKEQLEKGPSESDGTLTLPSSGGFMDKIKFMPADEEDDGDFEVYS